MMKDKGKGTDGQLSMTDMTDKNLASKSCPAVETSCYNCCPELRNLQTPQSVIQDPIPGPHVNLWCGKKGEEHSKMRGEWVQSVRIPENQEKKRGKSGF